MSLKTAVILSFFLPLSTSLFAQSSTFGDDELAGTRFANGIAAIVEDKIITAEDVRREVMPFIPQLQQEAGQDYQKFRQMLDDAEDMVIENLTDSHLIVKDFYEDKGQIPGSYVRNEVDERIITQFNGERAEFLAYLKSIGKTPEEYDVMVRDEMIVGFMQGKMRKSQAFISPVKIEAFYKENLQEFFQEEAVHLHLIQLSQLTDETPGLLEQTAAQIAKELDDGSDFAELAKKHSQDSKKDKGGDWGWIEPKSLLPELSEAAFALKAGEHSEAIKVKGGFFILKVSERREEGYMPIEDVREDIENMLISEMAQKTQDRWLERLRRDGYVRRFN